MPNSHFARCWRPFSAVLYFIFFQMLLGTVSNILPWKMSIALTVIFVTLFSSMLTMILLVHLDYVTIKDVRTKLSGRMLLLFVLFMLLASIGINVIEELCEIPDMLEDVMTGVMANPLGVLAVAVIGPIAEELTFRGGLMGGLMKSGYRAKTAIIVSALCFGIIHMNPVQIVFAGVMGLLLGWAYWRTGSLMPCILMHIANNSFSVLMFYICSNPQGRITDELGVHAALLIMAVSLITAYYLYSRIDEKMKANSLQENDWEF